MAKTKSVAKGSAVTKKAAKKPSSVKKVATSTDSKQKDNDLMPSAKSLGHQVRIVHRAFDRLLAARMAPFGIKSGYWYYLRVLWVQEGLTQRELGDAINVKENTTVAMIMAMEKDGLVTRKKHDTDRRKMCVFLTDKAKKLKATMHKIPAEVNEVVTEGISDRDIAKCLSVLDRVSKNIANLDA